MIAIRADIRRAAGQAIICGFDGTALTPELKEILREVKPAGLVLFSRNIVSPEQVTEFNRELKYFCSEPLLLCVDQEGGRVARIRHPATVWPTMQTLGKTLDPVLAERFGRALASELKAMNFDINFAPVLDVNTNPNNPIIGDRALGADPQLVAKLGNAIIAGLRSQNIGACGKHFPGHGDTDLDSHLTLPSVSHDHPRLRTIEWLPFRAAINSGLEAIMTAHLIVESLDSQYPATLSPKILSLLRAELGFEGVIVSDDIEMKALADHFSPEQIAARGLNAGVDIFLACHQPETILRLYRGIVLAVEAQTVSHNTLLSAEARVKIWQQRFYAAPKPYSPVSSLVGSPAHIELAQEIVARSKSENIVA